MSLIASARIRVRLSCSLVTVVLAGVVHAQAPNLNLPRCTEAQLEMRLKSSDCFARSFAREQKGICPDDCCCSLGASATGSSKRFGAVGSCFIQGFKNQVGDVVALQILPLSPLETGTDKKCGNVTSDVCGELIGDGCLYDPPTPKEDSAGATPASSSGQGQENSSGSDSDSGGGSSTNRVIALSVCISLLVALVAAATVYFIVLPWLRGATRDSEHESDYGTGDPSDHITTRDLAMDDVHLGTPMSLGVGGTGDHSREDPNSLSSVGTGDHRLP